VSLLYSLYACHAGALVMDKRSGAVAKVRGNASLWDTKVVIVAMDAADGDQHFVDVLDSKEFARFYLVLDEGEDPHVKMFAKVAKGLSAKRSRKKKV
jgi:hypothetical protein